MATQNERAVVDLVINGRQSEATMKSLTAATINQRKALYAMSETDPGYKKQKAELEALMRAQRERVVRINDEKTAWEKFKVSAGSVTAGITGASLISAGLGAVKDGLKAANDEYKAFNAASQELSAVTGATGSDLEYLNRQAKQTGPAFGKSGAEMLEAYKLMASAKPELLAQKELLVETTQAALTLSRAGKIDLAEATTVTAESLNQFGAGADQANRFINVIAAGAKEGAAEINQMGAALKNSGTVAAAQGVSFEQTNAVLQSMSTIALKGGEAGTQLRNVLLTLGSGSDDTNPKVVGLETALDNLGKKNLSTAQLTKLFGKENITAAQHIITHRDEIATLTDKVTGTNEALSQAAKNNDTYEQKLAVFDATMSKFALTVGTKVIPVVTSLLEGFMSAANWLDQKLTPAGERATQVFEDQRTKVQGLERSLSPLLDRHDELAKKTNLTKTEQAELKNIVAQVSDTIPGAITQFDGMGNAMAVSTTKARQFVEAQKEVLKYTNRVAIEETKNEISDRYKEWKKNMDLLKNSPRSDGSLFSGGLDDGEVKQLQARNRQLFDEQQAAKLRLRGLNGSLLDAPGSTAPPAETVVAKPTGTGAGSGEESKEEKAARKKQEKVEKEREREAKAVEKHEDQLTGLIEQARARTAKAEGDAYLKEQIEFGDHYAKLYELAGDDKDKQVEITELMYTELAAITAREEERKAKADEQRREKEQRKKHEEYQDALDLLELSYEQERQVYEPLEAALLKSDEARKLAALEREEKFLTAKLLLAKAYGDNVVDVDKAITQNQTKQDETKADSSKKNAELQASQPWLIAEGYSAALESGAGALSTFVQQGTGAWKALIVAQKAAAIAGVVIDTQKEIRQYWSNPGWSALPDGGAIIKTAFSVAAGARAALSIATIAKQGAGELAQKDDGGFTGIQDLYGGASGFAMKPTRVNAGARSYIVGEKRPEWIMGGAMMENPVMANLAGALQALQVSGDYKKLGRGSSTAEPGGTAGGGAGGSGMSDQLLLALLDETRRNREEMAKYAKRPIVYDHFKIRESQDYLDAIDIDTSL